MCFGSRKKVKTAEEIYQEKKPDYGPLPSLSMGDPVQKNKMLTDVPQMRTSGMQARSLLKVNYRRLLCLKEKELTEVRSADLRKKQCSKVSRRVYPQH